MAKQFPSGLDMFSGKIFVMGENVFFLQKLMQNGMWNGTCKCDENKTKLKPIIKQYQTKTKQQKRNIMKTKQNKNETKQNKTGTRQDKYKTKMKENITNNYM